MISSYLRIAAARSGAGPRAAQGTRSYFRNRPFNNLKDKNAPSEGIPLQKNPFAEKAQARAKQLHNEIENLVSKHDQRHAQEAEKSKKVAGFTDFLSKNKTNLSVILVSFLTVVLSVKMVQNKQKHVELEKELEDTQSQLEEKRKLLKSISSEAFLAKVAENYMAKQQTVSNEFSNAKGWGWAAGGSNNSNNPKTGATSTETLVAVLANNLLSLIGNAALSEDEIQAKEFEELRKAGKEQDEAVIEKLSTHSETSGTEEYAEEWVEDADGKKTTKKSVFRI